MRSLRSLLRLAPLFASAFPALAQTTWYVDAAALPPGNGTPASPYASIQYAYDQPSTWPGDTLSIAPGDYLECYLFDEDKQLSLVGAGALQTRLFGGLTVLNTAGITRVENLAFHDLQVSFESADVEFEDVRFLDIDGGGVHAAVHVLDADSTWTDVIVADGDGGGILISGGSATLHGVQVVNCLGQRGGLSAFGATLSIAEGYFGFNHVVDGHGGGLYLDNSQTTLVDCEFEGNLASLDGRLGGALYLAGGQLSVSGGEFRANRADRGGALALQGQATLTGVTFQANVAQRDGSNQFMPGQGGAIVVGSNGTLTAEGCQFLVNSAPVGLPPVPEDQRGGAIFVEAAGSRVVDSLFADNGSGREGSAVFGPLELVGCRIQNGANAATGGAVHGALLERCTVFSNDAAAGSAALVDCGVSSSIVWANSGGQLGGSSSATFSCIQGGAVGMGNVAADPLFADPGNDILSLLQGSPCIDAGAPSAPLDPDLTPADMGALPFTWLPLGASYCSTHPNSSGQTAAIAALGSASVADDFLRVQATQTAVNQVGLFMISQNQGFVPFFNGSQGNLCVSAPIFRLTNTPGSVSSTGAQGLLNLRVGLTTLPAGLQILPGQTWHFQAWFRDNVGGNSTSNTSDAVSVAFQ